MKYLEPADKKYHEHVRLEPKDSDNEICMYCKSVIFWNQLDPEEIVGRYESRGEYWGAPCSEYVVMGFVCPGCGKMNEL